MVSDKVLVSIIIPTFNSQSVIEKCLNSLKRQTYRHLEIIVVDNYSNDATRKIASRYGSLYSKGSERCTQRNFGATKAKGEFLFFIDSDMELESTVVEECVNEAVEKNTDAIIVPEVSVGEGFWTDCKALERSCYINDSSIEAPRFFKKKAFLKLGGYDENLIAAEDWDLSQRLKKSGFLVSRINSLIKHHEGKLSLKKTMIKKYRYGMTISRYIRKHKEESKQQFVLIRPCFLKSYKRLFKKPVVTAGMVVMKACEFAAGLWGMFVNKCFLGNKIKK